MRQVVFVRRPPAEMKRLTPGQVVEQVVRHRPWSIPRSSVRPAIHQVDDALEADLRSAWSWRKRVLITTLTSAWPSS